MIDGSLIREGSNFLFLKREHKLCLILYAWS